MVPVKQGILIINGGSSSIKFAMYDATENLTCTFKGELKGIATTTTTLVTKVPNVPQQSENIAASDYESAIKFLLNWLNAQNTMASVKVIGHRLVHGMHHTQPETITDQLLHELKTISTFDPEHLPAEIKLIEAFRKQHPTLTQIACFDTSFHTNMPPVAKLLPIPRKYQAQGVQRYGFHGLSYAYLLQELERIAGTKAAHGRLILAHLGSGASLAAVKDGNSIDTSMGFTPTGGIPMSTRTGDLDPGVLLYLMQSDKLNTKQLNHLINHQSGLLGVSETSGDMQELLAQQHTDNRAAEAVELFCYQTKKWIGSFAAALGGLDTLVFTGGIGEHAPEIRTRICSNVQFLGIELDDIKNEKNDAVISTSKSKVTVRVIATNEELMIAQLVCHIMNYNIK